MGLLNWRRRSQRITEVVVRAEAVADDAHPRLLPIYVTMFVRNAESKMYVREELPREALIVASLSAYLGEVDNGGHAQFIGNLDWSEELRTDIKEGLSILGQGEVARIFADLEALSAADPERFARVDLADPYLRAFDDRFYGPVEKAINVALPAWIRTRPWLRVVPDADYVSVLAAALPEHPLAEARREARRRRNAPFARKVLLSLREALHRKRDDDD